MPDYKNAKIYKLWIFETDEIYIGSTTQTLTQRLSGHKSAPNKCTCKILFEKSDNVMIELIEKFPCDNKEQLNKKEGEFIRNFDCVNRCVAGRTDSQYRQENAEKIKEYQQANAEKIKEHRKERYGKNKEHIDNQAKEYRQENRTVINEKKKKYRQANAEKIKEYRKQYRQTNAEKIKVYAKQYREANKIRD